MQRVKCIISSVFLFFSLFFVRGLANVTTQTWDISELYPFVIRAISVNGIFDAIIK